MSEESSESEDLDPSSIGVYDGERNEKKERHGWGKAVLPNGDTYEGNYSIGKRNGFGTYRFKKNRSQYAGNYIYNIRQGFGTMIFPDGSKFEGNWTYGQKNGYGKYFYVNGDIYEGEWKKEKRHGLGAYFHAETGTYYKGWWNNGQRDGPAEVIFLNYKFIGTYKKNKAFGAGKFEFSNNSEATGAFNPKSSEEKTEEEGEDEEDFWKDTETAWNTYSINDLHKEPTSTMQELIDARMKVVQSEVFELDRKLILSLKPEEKMELPAESSLTDILGTRAGDATSQMIFKMTEFVVDAPGDGEEEEENEEVDEACIMPENTLAFTTLEVKNITAPSSENQPSAY